MTGVVGARKNKIGPPCCASGCVLCVPREVCPAEVVEAEKTVKGRVVGDVRCVPEWSSVWTVELWAVVCAVGR